MTHGEQPVGSAARRGSDVEQPAVCARPIAPLHLSNLPLSSFAHEQRDEGISTRSSALKLSWRAESHLSPLMLHAAQSSIVPLEMQKPSTSWTSGPVFRGTRACSHVFSRLHFSLPFSSLPSSSLVPARGDRTGGNRRQTGLLKL